MQHRHGTPDDRDVIVVFGDSNCRGFGAGSAAAYPRQMERALPAGAAPRRRIEVGAAIDGFAGVDDRLPRLMALYDPCAVVWQVPNAPVTPKYEWHPWLRPVKRINDRFVDRRRRRLVELDITDDTTAARDENDSWRYAVWLDEVERLNLAHRLPIRRLRLLATRPSPDTMPVADYLRSCERILRRIRERTEAPVIVVGPLPHSDDVFPGYHRRADAIDRGLSRAVRARPAMVHLSVLDALPAAVPAALRTDGSHLTDAAHRHLGRLLADCCERLLGGRDGVARRGHDSNAT